MANIIITPGTNSAFAPDKSFVIPRTDLEGFLLQQITTVVGSLEGDAVHARIGVVDDDPTSAIVKEGDPIDEGAVTFTEHVVQTSKFANLLVISNEQRRQPDGLGEIGNAQVRSVAAIANRQFLQAGTAPKGILSGVAPTALGDNTDALVDALAVIEGAYGNNVQVVAHPTAVAALRKFKTAAGSNMPALDLAADTLLGLPLIKSPAMPAGQVLVIAKNAVYSAISPLTVALSEEYAFNRDGVATRATCRGGWVIADPARLALLSVESTL
ncbi:phage major capsid protein [Allobranchiibius sp. GilTou38]|uniref:phage major capsid protein n=1 Tax=Allobranchiibius sp. GilTou38 TaxID=2815210 RepID=UPI001AA0F3CF|nr:phage major capsid protein [Allobranchiibius sp. GilTou38]MBO1765781.1 phage major capsid protein [Allobranchiibius sp. GilTou38]